MHEVPTLEEVETDELQQTTPAAKRRRVVHDDDPGIDANPKRSSRPTESDDDVDEDEVFSDTVMPSDLDFMIRYAMLVAVSCLLHPSALAPCFLLPLSASHLTHPQQFSWLINNDAACGPSVD